MSSSTRRGSQGHKESADHVTWPNLFVLGAPKSGTTSLFHYLTGHPDVAACKTKEPHYFSRLQTSRNLTPLLPRHYSEEQYLSLFPQGSAAPWCCEASTSYLYDGLSARRIRIASPTARAIVLLRDPRERAYAHYRNNVRDGIERRSFEDALREEPPTSEDWFHGYASISRYELQLPAAIKAFGDDLKILVYEEFFGAAAMSLADTFEWLDLDPSPAYTTEFKVYNPSSIPRVAITRGILGSRRLRGITRTFTTRPLRSAAYRAMMRATPASEMSVEAKTILSEILAPTYDTIGSVLGREIPAWGRHEVGP